MFGLSFPGQLEIRLRRKGHLGQLAMVSCRLISITAKAEDFVVENTKVGFLLMNDLGAVSLCYTMVSA